MNRFIYIATIQTEELLRLQWDFPGLFHVAPSFVYYRNKMWAILGHFGPKRGLWAGYTGVTNLRNAGRLRQISLNYDDSPVSGAGEGEALRRLARIRSRSPYTLLYVIGMRTRVINVETVSPPITARARAA